ncbi:hypothetical protein BpHYR1_001918 [Brachionus plicatilis]|uniref:Uncharacterized protein n=1 Tax=Brachionus plicatilis TaxID=10195 RepID=A0A3M7SCV5_BRAPC|nr:hypothetical protein BpHYR1_001918 [Brachionus plicatilis]
MIKNLIVVKIFEQKLKVVYSEFGIANSRHARYVGCRCTTNLLCQLQFVMLNFLNSLFDSVFAQNSVYKALFSLSDSVNSVHGLLF